MLLLTFAQKKHAWKWNCLKQINAKFIDLRMKMDEKEAVIFFFISVNAIWSTMLHSYTSTHKPPSMPSPSPSPSTGRLPWKQAQYPPPPQLFLTSWLSLDACIHPPLLLSSIRVLASLLPAPTATAKMSIN